MATATFSKRFQWKRNVARSPKWRVFSIQLEYSRPDLFDRMKEGDVASYREAYQYVERSLREMLTRRALSSSYHRIISYQTTPLLSCDGIQVFRVDDRYVYVGSYCGKIEILNRWTGLRVKEKQVYEEHTYLKGLHVNQQLLAVKYWSGNIRILDLATLEQVQLISELPVKTLNNRNAEDFCLRGHLLVNAERIGNGQQSLAITLRRFNPSTHQFGPVFRRALLPFNGRVLCHKSIHMDERYVIVDTRMDSGVRLLTAFDSESLLRIGQREFRCSQYDSMQSECRRGVVTVQYLTYKGTSCVAAWDIEKNIVQTVLDHPIQFDLSSVVHHFPEYQIVINYRNKSIQLLPVKARQRKSHCSASFGRCIYKLPSPVISDWPINSNMKANRFYFDGFQMVFVEKRFNRLRIVDFWNHSSTVIPN